VPEQQAEMHKKIVEMTLLVDKTIDEVRQIATDLRPGLLDHFGLPAAIEWLFKEFTERTGVACQLTVTPAELGMSGDNATMLFRVVQEAMTNIARHAQATKLKIALSQDNGNLQMDIQDNGRGITPAAVGNLKSLGLLGVRERVKSAGGVMQISGGPGRGTLLSVNIPSPEGAAK
jgi:signal transduction histidine kinase